STNYDTSLEYYFNEGSMVSLALFNMRIASFVQNSGTVQCNLPDADGVVRDRCVPVSTLVQGEGAQLHGVEADYKQAFTFLPGLLSHTGVEINGTYSPSTTGKRDLAGNSVPFPGNSEKSGNFIVWYQDDHWQARLALNYRSKELVSTNWRDVLRRIRHAAAVPGRQRDVQGEQAPAALCPESKPDQRETEVLPHLARSAGLDELLRAGCDA